MGQKWNPDKRESLLEIFARCWPEIIKLEGAFLKIDIFFHNSDLFQISECIPPFDIWFWWINPHLSSLHNLLWLQGLFQTL